MKDSWHLRSFRYMKTFHTLGSLLLASCAHGNTLDEVAKLTGLESLDTIDADSDGVE